MENGSINNTFKDFSKMKDMAHIVAALDRNQKKLPNILFDIGNTPLIKLSKIPIEEGIQCDMYAKCEFLNPGGSIKERIAYRMVVEAELNGTLVPHKSVIIEPTSGNTGIGLALAAAVKGYRCIIVLPEKMSDEKVNTLLALGAEIVRTPTEAASDSPESNINVAKQMANDIPNAVILNQYNNMFNPMAHYDGTAEEILWSLDDDVDMVVMGTGTGGTVSGIGHKIKQRCPKCTIVGVDPYGSILAYPDEGNESDISMYEVEGIGYDFIPATLDRRIVDKWVKTYDIDTFNMSRRLIHQEGLLCGGSSGAAMWAAVQVAKELKAGQKCVVVLPDNIRNYMTKFVSDPWMEARKFKDIPKREHLWWWEQPLTEKIGQSAIVIPESSSTSDAISQLLQSKLPGLVVLDKDSLISGMFTAENTKRRLANLSANTDEPLHKFVVKKYYKVDLTETPTVGRVSRILDIAPFVLVVKSDPSTKTVQAINIVTAEDLLGFITKAKKQ